METDVVVAGGGVSGLLIASALASHCSVVLVERCEPLPRNKYWLTDEKALQECSDLASFVDSRYEFLDFIAYDGVKARVGGRYCLWDTDRLIAHLSQALLVQSVCVLTGHRLYSVSYDRNSILVRANTKTIRAKLLVDCMGFGSPLVSAKNIAEISGYYIMCGSEVEMRGDLAPIALDNVVIDRRPTYFEAFPSSKGTAHTAIILPAPHHRRDRSLKGDLNFILTKSHYSQFFRWSPREGKSYFGIIPVGRLRRPALDRIVFFGEAGQVNPAASATGLARMLRTYRGFSEAVLFCLKNDRLRASELAETLPSTMTRMNRIFQETLFESLLSFTSDDFMRLVHDLNQYPDDVINDLVFAEFDFMRTQAARIGLDALLRPNSVLGSHILKSILRYLFT